MIKNSTFLNLSRLYQRLIFLLGIVLVLFSAKLTAQTVMAKFQFTNGNLAADPNVGEAAIEFFDETRYKKYDNASIGTIDFLPNRYLDGYIRLKIKTAGYTNIKLSTQMKSDNNKAYWDIYANALPQDPVIDIVNVTDDYVKIYKNLSSGGWGAADEIPLATRANPNFNNRNEFVYVYFKAYHEAGGGNYRRLYLDNITITGCRMPDPPLAAPNQNFCGSAKVSDLTATATSDHSLSWYDAAGNLLSSTSAISTGTYYVQQIAKTGTTQCPPYPSDKTAVNVIVSPASVGGTVSSAQTICSGTAPANLTLSGRTGSVIKWQRSTDISFSPSTTTDISNTSTTLSAGILTTSTYFRAVVQSGVCSTANSSAVLITVNATSVGGTVSSAQTICSGTAPANLTLSGHTGNVIRWERSTDVNFISSATTNISSTSTTLTTADIGNLTASTYFRAVLKSGVCSTANSSAVLITVNATSVGGTVSSAQTICSGTAPANLTLSGHTGNVIKWQRSTDISFSPSTTTDISNTSTTLSAGTLTTSTYFRAVVQNGVCATANSSAVLITADATSVGGTVSSAQTICSGIAPANLTLSGHTGNVIRWERSTDVNFISSATTNISSTSTTLTTADIGNLTTSTYFRAVLKSGVCSTANSSAVLITVNPNVSAGAISTSASTICIGFTTTYASNGTSGGTWSASNPAVALVDPSTGVVTGIGAGTATITYTLSSGCGAPKTATSTVTVNPLPAATVTYVNQYVCKDENAEFIISGTAGAEISYTLNGIAKTGVLSSSGTLNISEVNAESNQTLQLISINNGTCTASLSNSATVKVGADAVFNGTTWSPALPYDNGLNAVINNDYNTNTSGSIKACNCTVNSGKSLTIAKDTYVEIKNTLINNGTVTVEMDGNLIQRNNFPKVPNAGEVTVQKLFTFKPKSSEPDRQQYNYISSPVIGGYVNKIFNGSPATAIYHSEARNMFYSSTGFNVQGRALAVKEPSRTDVPANTAIANFVGKPFSGVLKYPVAYTVNAGVTPGHNLLGNPYPSNLDLEKLYNYSDGENKNSEVIESTFRFWDNRYNTLYRQLGSQYTGDSYAKFNVLSGTGVPAATAPNSTADPRVPDGNLTIGTGFMVRALPAANGKSVVFENSMRTAGRGKTFYGRAIPKDRYWLSLKTPANMQLINAVVYLENGSNAVGAEDTSFSSSSDGIFTIAENRGLSIQGRSSFNREDKVDLGLSVFAAGDYTISLYNFEGIFADNQHIYLNDKEAGIITDLTEGAYTFNAKSSGLSTGRFEIVYKIAATLATVNVVKTDVKIYLAENGYLIKAPNRITKLEVYEMTGRLIQSFKPNSVDYMLNSDEFSNGVYLLKIEQGDSITVKKIIK